MIQQTSIEAYKSIQPHLGQRQEIIYDTIQQHPNVSNHDLSRILGLEINTITPRVKELRDFGLIRYSMIKEDRITGKAVMCWTTNGGMLFE